MSAKTRQVGWWEGPTGAVDRCLYEFGLRDWWEIDEALDQLVPPWLIKERIAEFHAQRVPVWAEGVAA